MALFPPSELDAVKGGGGEDGVSSELVQGILDLLLDQVIAVAIPPRLPAFLCHRERIVTGTGIGTYLSYIFLRKVSWIQIRNLLLRNCRRARYNYWMAEISNWRS